MILVKTPYIFRAYFPVTKKNFGFVVSWYLFLKKSFLDDKKVILL